jgi:hypothetical protein
MPPSVFCHKWRMFAYLAISVGHMGTIDRLCIYSGGPHNVMHFSLPRSTPAALTVMRVLRYGKLLCSIGLPRKYAKQPSPYARCAIWQAAQSPCPRSIASSPDRHASTIQHSAASSAPALVVDVRLHSLLNGALLQRRCQMQKCKVVLAGVVPYCASIMCWCLNLMAVYECAHNAIISKNKWPLPRV